MTIAAIDAAAVVARDASRWSSRLSETPPGTARRKRAIAVGGCVDLCTFLRNPVQGERDSGMIRTLFQDESEQGSGMMVNTDSVMKPNTFRPIPEPRSA